MSRLSELNQVREREAVALRDRVIADTHARPRQAFAAYPLPKLRALVAEALNRESGQTGLRPQLDFTDRQKLGGDLAIKVPELLKQGGAANYIKTHVPWIVQALSAEGFASIFAHVEAKGMYVNVRLTDRFLLQSLSSVLELERAFGFSDAEAARSVVVDYSSPNVAKQLHAGHIRSTIIGHVLCNLHAAAGARVFRVNHINDFGGFGFTLEGYRRWNDTFTADMSPNDKLLKLYAIRRSLERSAAHEGPLHTLAAEDKQIIDEYLEGAGSKDELRVKYETFVTASDGAFEQLEAGDPKQVAFWQELVAFSVAEFQKFYDALGVTIDFTLGESFYFKAGNELVEAALASGKAVLFTKELGAAAKARADQLLAEKSKLMTEPLHAAALLQIEKDIGAVVIPLPNDERLVVRRSDGRSIYATRDLGAIALRRRLFNPTDITYVVGQEQQLHFERLFKAAEVLGLVKSGDGHDLALEHLFFGFYVDAKTGKKLSSREGASNVYLLLQSATEHFARKYQDDPAWTKADVDETAKQLAVGSVVFNDLKKDMKGAVEISSDDLSVTMTAFEKSGGAYVVYAACRARSILRKFQGELEKPEALPDVELTAEEVDLILKLQQIPEKIVDAADQGNPSVLVRHLLDTATVYNSYYTHSPVLKDGDVRMHRLLITAAVCRALENALRICHIECPQKI